MIANNNILGRIRTALGHKETIAPPSRNFVAAPAPVAADTELVQLFCAELTRVGGNVSLAESGAGLKNCLEEILIRERPALVAISDVVVTAHEELLNSLAVNGIDVLIPPQLSASAEFEIYQRELLTANIGVTTADYAIADTGTLVLLSGGECHRLISLLPPVHICLLDSARIFPNLAQLLRHLHSEVYSDKSPPQATTFITGPSRTADIEHILTTGVHGPSRLEVLIAQ